MLGYEGYVTLQVFGAADTLLGTGASVPRGRVVIASDSAYGGQIKTPESEIAVGPSPHVYDWENFDGSINFHATMDTLSDHVKPWLFDRQLAGTIVFSTRGGVTPNNQEFQTAYWSNIAISTTEGGFVDTSIGFTALERFAYTYGDTGLPSLEDTKEGLHYTWDDNCANVLPQPIPFWDTQVSIDSSDLDFIEWNMDYSQEVVKFFACEGNSTVQEPRFVAVGPMTATFSGTYILEAPAADSVSNIEVEIGTNEGTPLYFNLNSAELTTISDDIQTGGSFVPLSVEYAAYEIAS